MLRRWRTKYYVELIRFAYPLYDIAYSVIFMTHFYFLESFRAPVFGSGPDKDGFNLGKSKNFCQVFGTNRWLWFLPVYTTWVSELNNAYPSHMLDWINSILNAHFSTQSLIILCQFYLISNTSSFFVLMQKFTNFEFEMSFYAVYHKIMLSSELAERIS